MCAFVNTVGKLKLYNNINEVFSAKTAQTNHILACSGFGARKHTIKNFPNDFHFLAEIT